jgi:hypothetical protein
MKNDNSARDGQLQSLTVLRRNVLDVFVDD